MEISSNQDKKIEDIPNEDWPLLKELESTRFALKNKKGHKSKKSLTAVRDSSATEDEWIAQQNIEDEKLVDAFLEEKDSMLYSKENSVANPSSRVQEIKVAMDTPKKQEIKEPELISQKVAVNVVDKDKEEVSKLIALGMAKIYIKKTDDMLQPIRFLLDNASQLIVALIQFLIPALITWFIIKNVEIIYSQLNNEPMHIYMFYVGVFYFACLFLWISGQVVLQGIWNMIKVVMSNLAKEGKN
jgi:hypothetical protein